MLELIIVGAALSIISLAVHPFIKLTIDSYTNARSAKYALQTARIGMNRMIAEIREIQGTDKILTFGSQNLEFINASGEEIEYTYGYHGEFEDYSIDRRIDRIWYWRWGIIPIPTRPIPLIPYVNRMEFEYLDEFGNTATVPENIWTVRIDFELEYNGFKYELQNQISPRNLQL
jgi:hypothetical protein